MTFRALGYGDILREERARQLREFNQCHTPAGSPAGGQFCATGGGDALPEDPDRYFVRDHQTQMVRLDQLDTIRARPDGIMRAEQHMRASAAGTHAKRQPIRVRKKANGRYEVLDGNSTTAVARKHGWTRLPAHVE